MARSLGQVAYEAWHEWFVHDRGLSFPTWEARTEGIDADSDAWQAAAEAAVTDWLAKQRAKLVEREAVIEAAKLFLELEPFRHRYLDYDQQKALDAIVKAARALDSEEK